MTPNDKAAALVDMGLVRLTNFDVNKKLTGADVAARNLETAQVRFSRSKGTVFVVACQHRSPDGEKFDHPCEGHANGHVCYHARAALMMFVSLEGGQLEFCESENAAKATSKFVCRVAVPGKEAKAVWGAMRAAV